VLSKCGAAGERRVEKSKQKGGCREAYRQKGRRDRACGTPGLAPAGEGEVKKEGKRKESKKKKKREKKKKGVKGGGKEGGRGKEAIGNYRLARTADLIKVGNSCPPSFPFCGFDAERLMAVQNGTSTTLMQIVMNSLTTKKKALKGPFGREKKIKCGFSEGLL